MVWWPGQMPHCWKQNANRRIYRLQPISIHISVDKMRWWIIIIIMRLKMKVQFTDVPVDI